MSKEVKRYVATRTLPAASEWNSSTVPHTYVRAADYDALLAERDAMKSALEHIVAADWSSSETATDFAISQAKGLLIGKMKRIAAAALQGAQP